MSGSYAGSSFSSAPPQTQSQQERIDAGNASQYQIVWVPETTRERDQVLRTFTQPGSVPLQPREEHSSLRPRRSTGPQDDESRAIREAARQRLAEQRRQEREATRQQREMMRWMEEEEYRRQQTDRIRRQEERRRVQEEGPQRQELGRERHPQSFDQREWLERYRQSRQDAALRRQELADHTSQRRQQARGARQEVDSSTPEYGIVFSFTPALFGALLMANH